MTLFDTTNATGTGVQDGVYQGTIVGVELKDSKSGKGKYLNVKWKLENGSTFFAMYTIQNENKTAENIGLAELSRLQIACGKMKGPVNTTDELLGLTCMIGVKNVSDDYGDKLKIRSYAKLAEGDSPFL